MSVQFAVTFDGRITVTADAPENLEPKEVVEAHLDAVMDELITLGASGPSIDVEISSGLVTLTVAVAAQSPIAALAQASGLLRTAIHAAGGGTPDWPGEDDEAWSIRLVDVRSSEVPTVVGDGAADDGHLIPA